MKDCSSCCGCCNCIEYRSEFLINERGQCVCGADEAQRWETVQSPRQELEDCPYDNHGGSAMWIQFLPWWDL